VEPIIDAKVMVRAEVHFALPEGKSLWPAEGRVSPLGFSNLQQRSDPPLDAWVHRAIQPPPAGQLATALCEDAVGKCPLPFPANGGRGPWCPAAISVPPLADHSVRSD
jgi:hypothetical protein